MGDTDTSVIVDEHASIKEKIIAEMRLGVPFVYACPLAGISRTTGWRLRNLTGEEKERLEKLEKQDRWEPEEAKELEGLRMKKSLTETFETQIEAARADYLKTLVTRINIGALKSPSAAMEILRNQFSDEYNTAKKVEHSGEVVTGAAQLADALQKIYERKPIAPRAEGSDTSDSQ